MFIFDSTSKLTYSGKYFKTVLFFDESASNQVSEGRLKDEIKLNRSIVS